jgi:hypothetical protein
LTDLSFLRYPDLRHPDGEPFGATMISSIYIDIAPGGRRTPTPTNPGTYLVSPWPSACCLYAIPILLLRMRAHLLRIRLPAVPPAVSYVPSDMTSPLPQSPHTVQSSFGQDAHCALIRILSPPSCPPALCGAHDRPIRADTVSAARQNAGVPVLGRFAVKRADTWKGHGGSCSERTGGFTAAASLNPTVRRRLPETA